jgi:hypothetical protein
MENPDESPKLIVSAFAPQVVATQKSNESSISPRPALGGILRIDKECIPLDASF